MNLETLEKANRRVKPFPALLALLPIFKFFASLNLAIFVLISLMIVFATGTFIESLYGTEAAGLIIYQSAWFQVLLVLLGINVTAAALDRLPWEKKHTGFVITHLGIILILIGSFVSRNLMVDGQIAIEEGKSEHRLTLPAPLLYIFSGGEKKEWMISIKKRPFAWTGEQKLALNANQGQMPFDAAITAYYPKSRMREEIVESREGPAALQVTLRNSFINQEQWLMENHPEMGNTQVGPAAIKFTNELLKDNEDPVPAAGYLEFQFPQLNAFIPIKDDLSLPASFPLEGTPYRISIIERHRNAVVEGSRLSEGMKDQASSNSSEWKNPAVHFWLEGEGLKEKHTVFAKFPDFPTLHGMKPSQANVRILYRLPGGGARGETHELRFVNTSTGLRYQIRDGWRVKSGQAELGKDTMTGWMDLAFRVDRFYPNSEMRRTFSAEPNTSTSSEVFPAVRLELEKGADKKNIWLRQGFPEKMEWKGINYHLLFGEKRQNLGFRLELRDFRVEHYPGTNNPASFESDVLLKDDSRGVERSATISMNKPLIYRKFRIYQSGYNQAEGKPDISIFSVGSDPGVPIKYLGAAVMVAGMVIMFSMRRLSSNAGQFL